MLSVVLSTISGRNRRNGRRASIGVNCRGALIAETPSAYNRLVSSRQQADSNTNFRSARAVSTRNSRDNPSLLLVVTGQLGHYHPNNNKKTRQLLNRKSRVKSRDKRGIASLFCPPSSRRRQQLLLRVFCLKLPQIQVLVPPTTVFASSRSSSSFFGELAARAKTNNPKEQLREP